MRPSTGRRQPSGALPASQSAGRIIAATPTRGGEPGVATYSLIGASKLNAIDPEEANLCE